MNKKVTSRLRKIADSLPPCTTTHRLEHVRLLGSKILAEEPEATDGKGQAIDPNQLYIRKIPAQLNHYKELKKMYEQFGENGVVEYTQMIQRKTAEAEIQENYAKVAQAFPTLKEVVQQEGFSETSNAYKQILGMGVWVVPFILQDMQEQVNPWFDILQKLTNENPVLPENDGNMAKMTNDWLLWGIMKKYFSFDKVKFAKEIVEDLPVTPQPKKRGRKPKVKIEDGNDSGVVGI